MICAGFLAVHSTVQQSHPRPHGYKYMLYICPLELSSPPPMLLEHIVMISQRHARYPILIFSRVVVREKLVRHSLERIPCQIRSVLELYDISSKFPQIGPPFEPTLDASACIVPKRSSEHPFPATRTTYVPAHFRGVILLCETERPLVLILAFSARFPALSWRRPYLPSSKNHNHIPNKHQGQ